MDNLAILFESFCYKKDLLLAESNSARKNMLREKYLGLPPHKQPPKLFKKTIDAYKELSPKDFDRLLSKGKLKTDPKTGKYLYKVNNDPDSARLMQQYGLAVERPDLAQNIASGSFVKSTKEKLTPEQQAAIDTAMDRRLAKQAKDIGYSHHASNSMAINPYTIKDYHMTLRGQEYPDGSSTDIYRLSLPRRNYIHDRDHLKATGTYYEGQPIVDENGKIAGAAGRYFKRDYIDKWKKD